MKKSISDARLRGVVKNAIRHAESAADGTARGYVEALRGEALARLPEASRGRASALSLSVRRSRRGARLDDDARYLDNVRALARRTASNARIIGGSAVVGKAFLDCVAVGDDDDWGCTGTLIAPRVVLTAGHCEALHTRIFVGNDVDKTGREYRVARHVIHPRFDATTLRNDVMLLVLDRPVAGVEPRKLASAKLMDAATDARVVGFGTTDLPGTSGYGVKRQVDVPVVSTACKGKVNGRADRAVYGCHLGKEIVAGKPLLLRDTCRGDSGGPLYVVDGKGRWFLAGVTSRGTDLAATMCGDGGLYTRVDAYRDWIRAASK